MLHNKDPQQTAEIWQFDLDIEQAERFLRMWKAQANANYGTGFGEAIGSIADGYVDLLASLRRIREEVSP